ncbi:MAG: hypothetical protein ACREHE_05220 [Rhizomicrobium sp.]
MRSQAFLQSLAVNYNPANAQFVAGTPAFRGGWEGWLQVEIARTFIAAQVNNVCEREMRYPDGQGTYVSYNPINGAQGGANGAQAARADFFLQRPVAIGVQDQTFLELKCSNALAGNPVQDAWARFDADIAKITAIMGVNNVLNCIALLAYWGILDPNNNANQGGPNGHPLNWYWANNRQSYIWDTSLAINPQNPPAVVTTLQAGQAAVQNVVQIPRLLIIATSP